MSAYSENRAGIPGLGVYHPRYACAFCGAERTEQRVVVMHATRARGLICVDTLACQRRRTTARQLSLFAEPTVSDRPAGSVANEAYFEETGYLGEGESSSAPIPIRKRTRSRARRSPA
jgi:hypothetical protein